MHESRVLREFFLTIIIIIEREDCSWRFIGK